MEILKTRVLRGPNYWSNYRTKLIVIELDIKEYEEHPSHLIPGFNDKLKTLLPSLNNHHCGLKTPGGFYERLETGTWLGHIVEHVALELQWLAGMECTYGRTRSTNKNGVYNVVFAYELEEAGLYAGKVAVKLVTNLAKGLQYLDLQKDIATLKKIYKENALGPSANGILEEIKNRKIPYTILDNSLMMIGYGKEQKLIWSTLGSQTSIIGTDIAADKFLTKKLLAAELIPVAQGMQVLTQDELDIAIDKLGFPLVIKPLNSNHGKGVTTRIVTRKKAIDAFELALKYGNKILVEKYVSGDDYRFLVINYKVVAVAKRTPACIVGNGISTIKELINEINDDPKRGNDHDNFLTKVSINEITLNILAEKNLTLESILDKNHKLYVKDAANLSSGGTAEDVTELTHQHNIDLTERVARLINIDICGIDIVAQNIALPINNETGAVIEVNAAPGLRMHISPSYGKPRNVCKPIVDMLFPDHKNGRIPITAVTGTNGKTTVVRLVAHMANQAGYAVGFTTTEGISINNVEILHGDCSGPHSAQRVLRDPIVDFAVLECARGGIIRSGLGFDHCNVSVITNISEDHLGQDGIDSLEELARVKSVVAQSTLKNGFAILNADDALVMEMQKDLECNIALFSTQDLNEEIIKHHRKGGLVAFLDNNSIIIKQGSTSFNFGKVTDFPITFFGRAKCMIKNLLPAILVGITHGFSENQIKHSLSNFNPVEKTPGRMNIFIFEHFTIMVDYAHNAAAFSDLQDYMNQIEATRKIGIIAATGDRRVKDIMNVGYYAAETFNEIIIRHDADGRGRTNQELTELIMSGIKKSNKNPIVRVISNEFEAIQYAIENAESGSFIFYFPDDVLTAINFIKEMEIQKQKFTISIR